MRSSVITGQRFETVIASIPSDGDAIGLDRGGVYYIVKKEKSGIYQNKPYTKPACIQISDDRQRFWIERIDGQLRATYDPNGGFNQTSIDDHASFSTLERYFQKLEGHLKIVVEKRQGATSPKSNLTMDDLRAFLRLLLPWCDEAQRAEVEHAVRSAVDAPHQYVRDHLDQLARRGIHRPTQNLPVIALVDALQAMGAAAEIDWNAGGETIYAYVSQLTAKLGIALSPAIKELPYPTIKILRWIDAHLSAKGHRLITIDIDADAYVLLIVSNVVYPDMQGLADTMNLEIGTL